MKIFGSSPRTGKLRPTLADMDAGSWSVVAILLLALGAASYFAYVGWMTDADIPMSDSAYVAIALGVCVSIIVGAGLMALIFFSSRSGYDESPQVERDDKKREE